MYPRFVVKEITDDVKLQEHMKVYKQIIRRHLITKKILDDSINFARQHVQMQREDFSIIQQGRKSLL